MNNIKKAIAAGIGALGTGMIAIASDGAVSWVEGLIVVGGALATFGATWGVTNDASL